MSRIERLRSMVEVGGGGLAVEDLRPADGQADPALVLLHEGLGCIGLWRDLPSRLAARLGRRTIAYDRHGHGGSGPLRARRGPHYLHDEAEAVLPALLDRLGIERALLVGHSDGGSIALLHAAAFPDRVPALATIAAHVFVEEVTLAGIRAAVAAYEEGDLASRLARHHGGKTDALFHAWADTWLAPWFRDWSIEDCLPRVVAPVLVVQGEADAYGSPAQVEGIARGVAGPSRRLLLPGAGHAPHLEAPSVVEEALVRFMTGALAEERKRVDPGRESP